MIITSIERIFLKEKFFNSIKLDNSLPAYEKSNRAGLKPMNEDKINFILEIFKVEINKFWTNNGIPIDNLINIKYSYEDFFMILLSFSEYFEIYFEYRFFKK